MRFVRHGSRVDHRRAQEEIGEADEYGRAIFLSFF